MQSKLVVFFALALLCLSCVSAGRLLWRSNQDRAPEDAEFPQDEIPNLVSPLEDLDDVLSGLQQEPVTAPCCFPTKWQGNVDSQTGYAGKKTGLVKSADRLFVDVTGQRLAGNKAVGPFGNETVSFIVLFKANNTADLYAFKAAAKKCEHKKLQHAVLKAQCIPPNATLQGSLSIGPKSGGLQVQSWLFRGHTPAGKRGPQVGIAGRILVTPSQCIPVVVQDFGKIELGPRDDMNNAIDESSSSSDSESGDENEDKRKPKRRGVSFVASAYFSNVELTISDPSVFTPPSYCNTTVEAFGSGMLNGEEMPSVLERFISFE